MKSSTRSSISSPSSFWRMRNNGACRKNLSFSFPICYNKLAGLPGPHRSRPAGSSLFILTFCYRGCRINVWTAGLPAAFCGWTLEAIKPDRGDPPVQNGAGFDGAYTAAAGHLFIFPRIAQNYVFIFYVSLDEKNVHFVRDSCKIFLQTKLPFGSCNVVLRARAVRSPLSGR